LVLLVVIVATVLCWMPCKCGSTTHSRTNHSQCPLNKTRNKDIEEGSDSDGDDNGGVASGGGGGGDETTALDTLKSVCNSVVSASTYAIRSCISFSAPCFDICLARKTDQDMGVFSLKGTYRCKVVSVYDGDTVTIVLFNYCGYEKHKLRMLGYDSPEMKPLKTLPNREEEIRKAKEAKAFLEDLVLDKIVLFESSGYDKYGRLLGKLLLPKCAGLGTPVDVNQLVVDKGHGYPYFGGTKKTSSEVATSV